MGVIAVLRLRAPAGGATRPQVTVGGVVAGLGQGGRWSLGTLSGRLGGDFVTTIGSRIKPAKPDWAGGFCAEKGGP